MQRLFSVTSLISFIENTRPSDRWILRLLFVGVLLTTAWLILSINAAVSVSDIRAGGSLEEGILGTPRFVNPVLANTKADQDVTALVYSGLLSIDSAGELVADIAKGWTVSEDGTVYTIVMRDDVVFHDGVPVTAADVIYTIELIQNRNLRSDLLGEWSGANIEVINDHTVEIVLTEPYAPFIDNLTIGILPAHIWRPIPTEQIPFSTNNTTPVGSGPYMIDDAIFGKTGTVSNYSLVPAPNHKPHALLSEIKLSFHTGEEELVQAFEDGDITSSAYLPTKITNSLDPDDYNDTKQPMTRAFALFFNQNKNELLRDLAVREALEVLINREDLVTKSLDGAGIPITSAVPTRLSGVESGSKDSRSTQKDRFDRAAKILSEAGWTNSKDGNWSKQDAGETVRLSITVSTLNSPDLSLVLNELTSVWQDFGIDISTEQFTQPDLVSNVIRDREFDVLLFGIDSGRNGDLYPFWHSSQQDDPGLNVSQYANLAVDEFLEDLRIERDEEVRAEAFRKISTIIQEEIPAIFLFQPTIQYVTPANLTTSLPEVISRPADRFATISDWHEEESSLWPFFTRSEEN